MVDCNRCKWLNMTEREQTDKSKHHRCNKYGCRVFHKTLKLNHDPYLFPCDNCVRDAYSYFESK